MSAQGVDRESNWYKETGRHDDWFTHFDFKRYSEDDVLAAKSRYLQIVQQGDLDVWEGEYRQGVMLGTAELAWSRENGFVKAFIYHSLQGLNYGKISVKDGVVVFLSEKPSNRADRTDAFVQVKFGEVRYLVPREKLTDFASRVAGLKRGQENDYTWIKDSDWHNKVSGLPIFPRQFAPLVRKPITLKIVSIGPPRLRQDKFDSGEAYATYHERIITLNGGASRGVKVGMEFFIDDWHEWVTVNRVWRGRAIAVLSRSLFDSKKEVCWENDVSRDEERPCSELIIGVTGWTRSREFNF